MSIPHLPKKRKKETFTISFRVGSQHLSHLEKGAAPYRISVHEYARQRLIELLERQDEAQLFEEAKVTRQSVEALRADVAATLEVILNNTLPGDEDEKRARVPVIRDWINRHLRRETTERETTEPGEG